MPTPVALIVTGLLLVVVVAAIIGRYREYWSRERLRAAARLAAQATPVTFTVGVNVQLKGVGFHGPRVEPAYLTIRGDVIEISSPFGLWRRLAGREYYLDARSTTFSAERNYRRQEQINISGRSADRSLGFSMTSGYGVSQIWDALVAAGATPSGRPPGDRGRPGVRSA